MTAVSTVYQTTYRSGVSRQLKASIPPDYRKYKAVFEKEILRVGDWNTGAGTWHVTPKVLDKLVHSFRLMRKRGVKSYLVWNHSDDAEDQSGDILQVFTRGTTLYCHIGTNDPKAILRLGKINNEVSVEAIEQWEDGKGNEYPIALTHVAIVQHPVVNGQKPFKRILSRQKQNTSNRAFQLRLAELRLRDGKPWAEAVKQARLVKG